MLNQIIDLLCFGIDPDLGHDPKRFELQQLLIEFSLSRWRLLGAAFFLPHENAELPS